jgi:hypothetical protein
MYPIVKEEIRLKCLCLALVAILANLDNADFNKLHDITHPLMSHHLNLCQTAMIKHFFFYAELDTLKLPTLTSSRMTMPLSV